MKNLLLIRLGIYALGVLLLLMYYIFNIFSYNIIMSMVSILWAIALYVETKNCKSKMKYYAKLVTIGILGISTILINLM